MNRETILSSLRVVESFIQSELDHRVKSFHPNPEPVEEEYISEAAVALKEIRTVIAAIEVEDTFAAGGLEWKGSPR